jgi:hypothetical protein
MRHLKVFQLIVVFTFLSVYLVSGVQTVQATFPATPTLDTPAPDGAGGDDPASADGLTPFLLLAPSPATLVSPADGAVNVPLTANLAVHVSDSDTTSLTVTFYGRQKTTASAPNFMLAAIPDTQDYTDPTVISNGAYYFNAQTQWIADNQAAKNIVMTISLGDITMDGDSNTDETQWVMAKNAYSILERGAGYADDVPYAMMPGNHEYRGVPSGGYPTLYEKYFGVNFFTGRPYYGGNYGSTNTNNYSLFNASGMHFILINLDCTATSTSMNNALLWADSLLKADVSRRAIVGCHSLLNSDGTFSTEGLRVFNALSDNPNLFLMLAGHAGYNRRADLGADGHTINTLMADYEGHTNDFDGTFRLMEFQPGYNLIDVNSFSPIRPPSTAYMTDTYNKFTLSYPMRSPDFTLLGTVTAASGTDAGISWAGLSSATAYEWYAAVNDGTSITVSPTWSFTTIAPPTCYALTLTHTGQGSSPTASPANSTGCSAGQYVAGETISLSGAVADAGWKITGWSGTSNNAATTSTNSLTMPGSNLSASVIYSQIEYTLTTTTIGSGTLNLDKAAPYHYGDIVYLTPVPSTNWSFAGWGEDLSGASVPGTVTITQNTAVTATFTPPTCYALTLAHTGQGSSPTANPANSTGCDAGQYVAGQTVSLNGAVADAYWKIAGWSGTSNNAATTSTNSLTMPGSNWSASVTYSQIEYTLTITTVGNGTVNPDKAAPYHYGDIVKLTPVPSTNWSFAGWSGALSGAVVPGTVTITQNTSVTATFTPPTCYTLTLTYAGQGSDPSASPANSGGCSAGQYVPGESISLSTASPSAGWKIAGWSGTSNDTSTAVVNSLTMPASDWVIQVTYKAYVFLPLITR